LSVNKQLVVNADDFGFTRDVNQGIIEAHQQGILTAATLMANGDAFDDAVRLARENPGLDVGAHLVLIGGGALATPGSALPRTVPRFLAAIASRRIHIYDELARRCGAFSMRDWPRPTWILTSTRTWRPPFSMPWRA